MEPFSLKTDSEPASPSVKVMRILADAAEHQQTHPSHTGQALTNGLVVEPYASDGIELPDRVGVQGEHEFGFGIPIQG